MISNELKHTLWKLRKPIFIGTVIAVFHMSIGAVIEVGFSHDCIA